MPQLNLPKRLAASPLILLVLIALVLQGCFHDDDDPAPVPVPDANPVGYYENAGTASVNGGALLIDDLQAMVHGNRIMIMSAANGLLYDGTITDISENEFTADFTIYQHGEKPTESTATATGQITEGSSITGTLNGGGFGSGTFSLLYASTNSEVAAISRIENTIFFWRGMGLATDLDFQIDDQGVVTHRKSPNEGVYDSCRVLSGSFLPINDSSLYSVNVTFENCEVLDINGAHTGLAATRDQDGVDDRLVYMISNSAYAVIGDSFAD